MILINQQVAGSDGRSLAVGDPGGAGRGRGAAGPADVPGRRWAPERARPARRESARFAAYLAKPVKHARLHELLMRSFAVEAPASLAGTPAAGAGRRGLAGPMPGLAPRCAAAGAANPALSGFGLAGARILIADDDADVRRTLERLLQIGRRPRS